MQCDSSEPFTLRAYPRMFAVVELTENETIIYTIRTRVSMRILWMALNESDRTALYLGGKHHTFDEKTDQHAVKGCCIWLNTLDPQQQFPGRLPFRQVAVTRY